MASQADGTGGGVEADDPVRDEPAERAQQAGDLDGAEARRVEAAQDAGRHAGVVERTGCYYRQGDVALGKAGGMLDQVQVGMASPEQNHLGA